ncbi:hypothetical protein [Kitasatospora sp. NPDC056531]|uniref:hypothetical protein n=1 Tax=Kitasatospora sp. NPDC056531 TaxID=3345856 RepID=UPI0036AC1BDE
MTTAFAIRGTTKYHSVADCPALDSARLNHRGAVFQITDTAGHTPCTVCASPDITEWTVTRDNLVELLELIGQAKPHYAPRTPEGPYDLSVQIDGLTIWAHRGQPRTVARFGDTITRQTDGTWTVRHAEETSR